MFEFEVDHQSFQGTELPSEIEAAFAESHDTVQSFSLLAWEEHCTECAMPQCYASCDLYAPRKDGKCRRFQYGFGYVEGVPSILGYVTKVAFKRWGQLLAYGNTHLVPVENGIRLEKAIVSTDHIIAKIPDSKISILGRTGISSRLRRRYKQKLSKQCAEFNPASQPDYFVAEIYNPQKNKINLTLIIRDADGELCDRPYQNLLVLEPGFNRFKIPYSAIRKHINPERIFHITLCPNLLTPEEEGLTLYFGFIGFVAENVTAKKYTPAKLTDGKKHVKVVAWDLDNTLWHGILVEDGEENIRIKDGIVDVIKELDQRGIVNSIVSKNDIDAVMPILKKLGIDDYFVFPKISWNPKSNAVLDLISSFNVGADTIAVIDDSEFERSEISGRCTGVRVYKEDIYTNMLEMPEFMPELSDESSKRREFYRNEELRVSDLESFGDDYLGFLRNCGIEAVIERASQDNITRVHELIQRTNQLNYSGNRYSRDDIEKIINDTSLTPICITCTDKFGEYGLVGFCLLDSQASLIKDLMFSCRVQSKRVEHALLCELMKFQKERGANALGFIYKKTPKNTPAARIFDDMKFQLDKLDDDKTTHLFSYDLKQEIPSQDIIRITWRV